MTDSNDLRQVTLLLTTEDGDLAERRELAVRLRDELLNGTVLDAEFATSQQAAPAHSKSPTAVTSDPILLTLAVTAIPSIILLIQSWLLRQQNQTLKVKIGEVELEVPRNATQAEIDRIVNVVRQIPATTGKSAKK